MPVALVLGCGENVWEDAQRAQELFTPDAVFAVKNMMVLWPGRVDYGITLHPDRTEGYLRDRKKLGRNTNFQMWAHRVGTNTRIFHKVTPDWQGSTGLFAVKIALEEKFNGIVLAGVPMVASMGHVARRINWGSCSMFKKGWTTHLPEIKDKVRSMSGWTMELLGAPTPEWLESVGSALPVQNLDQEPVVNDNGKLMENGNAIEGCIRKVG